MYKLKYINHDYFLSNDSKDFFSDNVTFIISNKVTELLQGVHPEGKKIVVPDESINETKSLIYENSRSNSRDMIDLTISLITNQIKDEFEIIENNNKLNIWNTVLGDYNELGLTNHSKIKLNNKKKFILWENY